MNPDVLLNNRYRLVDQLATGGMGEVWKATDELLGRSVAVKLLKREYVSDEGFRNRFRAEARTAASLQHAGIAQVFDYGEQDGLAYLVMELVTGEPLSQILTRHGRLSSEATLDIVAQAARGLQVAHDAGIIHRDVKPGNLMVTPEGAVKITDFGIARSNTVSKMTQTGMVMGTAQYVSPEQASGQPITASSDLYSLGIVMYECLSGETPFVADTPVAIALKHVREDPPPLPDDVPDSVQDLVGRLLDKEPVARPASAQQVADRAYVIRESLGMTAANAATEAVPRRRDTADDLPAVATMATRPARDTYGPPPRRQRGSRVLLTTIGVAVLVAAAIVVGSLWEPSAQQLTNGNGGVPTGTPVTKKYPGPGKYAPPSVAGSPGGPGVGGTSTVKPTKTSKPTSKPSHTPTVPPTQPPTTPTTEPTPTSGG